jgi:hypothetical protein
MLSGKTADGTSFIVVYLKDGIQLGDLEEIVDALGEIEELELAVLAGDGGEGVDEFADAGGVDVVDFAEVEEELFVAGGDEAADGVTHERDAFAEGDATNGVDDGDVADLTGSEASTQGDDSPFETVRRI